MPSYDYRCDASQQVFEVKHGLHEKLATWGELCQRLGIDPGDIDAGSPITRLISGGGVVRSGTLKNPEAPPCMTGGGCAGGSCGFQGF